MASQPNNPSGLTPTPDGPIPVPMVPSASDDGRPTQARVRIRIPKSYHHEPVISRLVSHYGLTVNIVAALLGANARDDGWFDLELSGPARHIDSAMIYLNELDLDVWPDSDSGVDGW